MTHELIRSATGAVTGTLCIQQLDASFLGWLVPSRSRSGMRCRSWRPRVGLL